MKRIFNVLKIAGLCAGFLLFAACPAVFENDLLGGAKAPAGKAVVQLNVARVSDRSIFPDEMEQFSYDVTSTADGKTAVRGTLDRGSGSIVLDAGVAWTILIEAKFEDEIVGTATIENVQLADREEKEYSGIKILPVTGATVAAGTLVYDITLPEVDSAVLYIEDTPIDLTQPGAASGDEEFAPGYYLVRAVLEKDGKLAGRADIVHVYPGLTTTVDWAFSTGSFSTSKDVTVSVNIASSAEVTIENVTLVTKDFGKNGNGAEAGGIYTFVMNELDAATAAVEGVYLEIETSKNTLTTAAGNYTIGNGNLIALDPLSIYAIKMTSNTNGLLKLEAGDLEVEQSGIVERDVFDATNVTVTATPSAGFDIREDSFIVTGAAATISDVADSDAQTAVFAVNGDDVTVAVTFYSPAGTYAVAVDTTDESADIEISGVDDISAVAPNQTVTVQATPKAGYKIGGVTEPTANATGVTFTPVLNTARTWTFTMPSENVTVSMNYPELGAMEIFKGGLKQGVTIVDSVVDCNYYVGTIDFVDTAYELEGGGHNGNLRVIKIERPIGEGRGEYGFTLNAAEVLKLQESGATALSFWVKGSKAKGNTFQFVGFGNANSGKVSYLDIANNFTSLVTTEWKQFIVPVPPMKAETAINRVFFIKFDLDNNHQVYLDDIEFLTATDVTFDSIAIPSAHIETLPTPAPFNPSTLLNGKAGLVYTTADKSVTARLIDGTNRVGLRNTFANWFDSVYSVDGDATMDGNNVVPGGLGAAFNLYLSAGGKISNAMAFSVAASAMTVIENFEEDGWSADGGAGGFWEAFGWTDKANATPQGGARYALYKFKKEGHLDGANGWWDQKNPPMAGRNYSAPIDLSEMTTLSFWIRTGGGRSANDLPVDKFSFGLASDAFNTIPGGTYIANSMARAWATKEFVMNTDGEATQVNGYTEIRIPLEYFRDAGVNLSNVTGWALSYTGDHTGLTSATDEYEIMLDTITAQ